jgi:hypothetical protein
MIDVISNFIFNLDPTSMLIGAVVSALIGLWIDFLIKQPVLERSGGGSGRHDADRTVRNNLSFRNKVGWFGINIPESRILGIKIHPSLRKGLTFEKSPVRDCRANLFLKDTNEHVGQLWWINDDGSFSETATIESGKQSSVFVFCRDQDETERYFVYRPTSGKNGNALVPSVNNQFIGEKQFFLRIDYSHSHRYEEVIKISRKFNGLLYLETKNGSTIF